MKDNTHLWYIVLGLIVVVSAIGTLAFLYYTTNSNSVTYQPLNTTATQSPSAEAVATPTPQPSPSGDPTTLELQELSNSDAVDQIKQDIDNTDLDSLDGELTEIEEQLQ